MQRHASPSGQASLPGPAESARFREPRWRLRLARWALLWEQLWPALWPAAFVGGLFALAVLTDLLPLLPGWAHAFAIGGFGGAFLYTLYRGLRQVKSPDAVAARRRLEQESGLPHRPLTALGDRLSAGGQDPESAALWLLYQRRLEASLRRLRVGVPRAGLVRIDPIGLRAALVLLLLVAAIGSWGDGFNRLARAVTPDFRGFAMSTPVHLDIWITPPAYTGIAPSFIDTAAQPPAVLKVPEGSTVLAQVAGGGKAPRLHVGETQVEFGPIGEETYRASAEALTGDTLRVEQDGRTLGQWSMQIIPDKPPTVALAKPPAASDRGALRLEYEAADDYGLDSVQASIRLPAAGAGAKGQPAGTPIELNLPLPGIDLKTARAASYHDLTPHPWAGLPVELRLVAKDARGQSGASEPLAFTLPEREFHHPVARAIIEQRKRLTLAPGDRVPVTRALGAIAKHPEAYNDDIVVILALRVAQRRLINDWTEQALAEIQGLLWDTAVRIEDGDLGAAERDLRLAQQRLQEALANNASDAEIEKLMDELQQAMNRYLDALAEKMQKDLANGAQMRPMDRDARMIDREELQRMLDEAREAARGGAREAAQEMLAQLQEMLENLQAMAGMPQQGDNPAMQMMQDLQRLTEQQQRLLEQSFRQSQQMQSGEPMSGMDQQAGEQEGLRHGLGDLMRQFGEMTGDIPRPMGRAERAMRDAVESLQQGDPGGAAEAQARALDQLQQAGQAMAEALAEQLGDQMGMGPPQDRFGQSRDPLGRSQPGMGTIDTGDVDIPDKSDLQRAREILDELRRRSGERSRPKPEREYIDRLLRRF